MDKAKKFLAVVSEFVVAVVIVGGVGMAARYGADKILTYLLKGE